MPQSKQNSNNQLKPQHTLPIIHTLAYSEFALFCKGDKASPCIYVHVFKPKLKNQIPKYKCIKHTDLKELRHVYSAPINQLFLTFPFMQIHKHTVPTTQLDPKLIQIHTHNYDHRACERDCSEPPRASGNSVEREWELGLRARVRPQCVRVRISKFSCFS